MSRHTPDAVESVFSVRDDVPAELLMQSLQALLRTRQRPIPRRRFSVMDTIDGRVRRSGGRLARGSAADGPTVWWRPRGGDGLSTRIDAPMHFAWDLPSGPLRQGLTPVIGVRRLFAQADAVSHGSILDVIDDREKTVARLRVESGQVRAPDAGAWRPLPTVVTVTALRGFEEAYARLVPVVLSRPGIDVCAGGFHGAVLRELGTPAWDTLSAARVDLDPDVAADEGARRIHLALLQVIVTNESGVRDRLDTEFLHDFRVAVRRTRSLLGQIRRVLPPIGVDYFRIEFSWLGALTGPARDLDVLALELGDRGADDRDTARAAILALLGARQADAYRRLREALNSQRYLKLVNDWRMFLEQPGAQSAGARDAAKAFGEVVSKRAWRLSRKIARGAARVNSQTPPERLHDLRIYAKKLRYLIDSTPGVFDAGGLDDVLAALKKLQVTLGDFNDAQTQASLLLDCRSELARVGASPDAVALAGRLAAERHQRLLDLRSKVVDRLERFASKPVQSACRYTFRQAVAG